MKRETVREGGSARTRARVGDGGADVKCLRRALPKLARRQLLLGHRDIALALQHCEGGLLGLEHALLLGAASP